MVTKANSMFDFETHYKRVNFQPTPCRGGLVSATSPRRLQAAGGAAPCSPGVLPALLPALLRARPPARPPLSPPLCSLPPQLGPDPC